MYHEIVKKIGTGGYQSNGFEEATEHARNYKLGKQTQTWENGRFCTQNVTLREISFNTKYGALCFENIQKRIHSRKRNR